MGYDAAMVGRDPIVELDPGEGEDQVVVVHTADRDEATASRASLDAIGCATAIETVPAGGARVWLVRVARMHRVPAAILRAMEFDVRGFDRLPSEPIERRRLLLTEALIWNAVSEGRIGETLSDPRVRRWAGEALELPDETIARAYREAEASFRGDHRLAVGLTGLVGLGALAAGAWQGFGAWGLFHVATVGLLVLGAGGVGVAVALLVSTR